MELRRVDTATIKIPEVRVRAQFDDELYQQFKESQRQLGNLTPIICYQVEKDLVLCDGEHRLEECFNNGDKEIDVVVIPGDMVDVLTKNILLDHTRGKHPVSEMIKVIKVLSEEYGLDSEQLKEKTGLTRDYIEKLQKVAGGIPDILQAIDQGLIGIGKAQEICRLPNPVQQEKVLAIAVQYGDRLPVKELKSQVDMILQEMQNLPPTPMAAAVPREPHKMYCEGCKQEVDPRYVRPALLCPICFGNVWELGKSPGPVESPDETDQGEG